MATAPETGLAGTLELNKQSSIICRVWNDTGRDLWRRSITGNRVHALAFGRQGKILAVGGVGAAPWMMERRSYVTNRGTVHVFDAATGRLWRAFPMRRAGYIHAIAVAPTAPILAVSGNGWVDLWDYSTQRMLGSLPMKGEVTSLSFSRDGKYLASASLFSPPTIWSTRTRTVAFTLPRQPGQTFGIAFSPTGMNVALAGLSFLSTFTATGRRRWIVTKNVGAAPSYDYPNGVLTFSPDGRWLAVSGPEMQILTADGRPTFSLPGVLSFGFGRKSLWADKYVDPIAQSVGNTAMRPAHAFELLRWQRSSLQAIAPERR